MDNLVSNISFWIAFLFSVGTLFFYLRLALKSRKLRKQMTNENYDFHLGVSSISLDNQEQVFAYALVAAGTSLSTVFVFFLTASSFFGWLVFLSPIMFSIGNFIMFKVYKNAEQNNYFVEENNTRNGVTGLVPYLGQALTGSKSIGVFLILLSFINLLAVLVLELFIGSDIISFLSSNTLHTSVSTPVNFSTLDFLVFSFSVVLLLGYVFVGGFRAVVASDFWQMKVMKITIALVFVSVVIKIALSSLHIDWSVLSIKATGATLAGFILNVVLANLFVPLSQESSWQRFRAFRQEKIDFGVSMKKSIINSLILWIGLILISFGLLVLSGNTPLAKITDVLVAFKSADQLWFPLVIFPLITASCLFAMYSTADTCVSALIYLIEYFYSLSNQSDGRKYQLDVFHKVGMVFILICSILIYLFIHKFFNPTILQLVFSVFSNLVVIAPTVLLTNILKPCSTEQEKKTRTLLVFISLVLGSGAYWGSSIYSMIKGADYLWLSQLSILGGLLFALLPLVPLFIKKNKTEYN